jgi:hypothetical protein
MDAEVAIYRAGRWEMSSPEDLLQSINGDPTWENMLFIHGNRTDLNWANLRGVETYESIVTWPESCQTAQPPVGPVRWIIWAWPSDPVHGPRADLAIKRSRAVAQGPYLRQFMSSITVDSLGVVAYSLGAQALVSALCTEEERVAPAETDERRPLPKLRVVMLAGAIPVRWMQSAEADDCFRRYLDNLTLINNPRDRALKIYLQFTGLHPIGTHRCQLDTSIAAETYLLHGNQLDNHFLSHYLEHAQTRQIIRARLFAAESTNATTSPLPAKD